MCVMCMCVGVWVYVYWHVCVRAWRKEQKGGETERDVNKQ